MAFEPNPSRDAGQAAARQRIRRRAATCAAAAALAAACMAAPAAAPAAGIWRSEGYGLAVRLSGPSMAVFQVARGSCTRVALARRRGRAGRAALYLIDRRRSLPVLDVDSGRLRLRRGSQPRRMSLAVEGAVSEIRLQRIPRLPRACGREPDRSPRGVLAVLAATYREHYPFFRLHHVDWTRATRRARARLGPASSRRSLFRTLRGLIAPLEDAHTWLETRSGDRYFDGERPDPQPLSGRDFKRARRIASRYLLTRPRRFARGEIRFAMLPGTIGYLRVASFSDYARSPRLADQLAQVDRALAHALAHPLAGLVIDVRVNGGGSDALGNRIASHLTDRPYVAYAKIARDVRRRSGFTPPQRVMIEPAPGARFTGPVAVLTSRYSVSAAETFAQALLGRRPAVERIGEATQGVFSDVLTRVLPNGWTFGLPNEIYLTDGRSYDVSGVPPTIATGRVFARHNLRAGGDPELERALDVLASGSARNRAATHPMASGRLVSAHAFRAVDRGPLPTRQDAATVHADDHVTKNRPEGDACP